MTSSAHFAELKGNSLGRAVYPPSLMALKLRGGALSFDCYHHSIIVKISFKTSLQMVAEILSHWIDLGDRYLAQTLTECLCYTVGTDIKLTISVQLSLRSR